MHIQIRLVQVSYSQRHRFVEPQSKKIGQLQYHLHAFRMDFTPVFLIFHG